LQDRIECIGGSFFESVPAGGDLYVLASVLHNWDDPHALQILRTCRQAMAPASRMLVAENDLGLPNESPTAKLADLNMLVIHGACERTPEELAALLGEAGLEPTGLSKTVLGVHVIEARGC
jgi:hypothetical protein